MEHESLLTVKGRYGKFQLKGSSDAKRTADDRKSHKKGNFISFDDALILHESKNKNDFFQMNFFRGAIAINAQFLLILSTYHIRT
jgi:hypothetical protein